VFLWLFWGFCRGVFCVGFVGVVCLYAAAWGVVVVVLVEAGLGVGLWFCVARRFINWISALHSILGGRVERFDRCKTRSTRRFIDADTYIAYISMCMGDVRLAAYAGRVCGDAALPTCGCLETSSSSTCLLLTSVESRADAVKPHGLLCTAWFKAWRLFRAVYENCGGLNNGGVFLPERVSAAVYTPRRLATQEEERQAANVAMPVLETSRFCVYAAVLRGERLHKNYQASCDTFLYCVLRKFWGGVSCLCLV